MCPKPTDSHAANYQRGASLVVALFIIIVMSLLAAILVRLISSANLASVDDVYGARALQSAHNGANIFIADHVFSDPQAACTGVPIRYTFSTNELRACEAQVSCNQRSYQDYELEILTINAQGACAVGEQVYSRDIVVEALSGL